MEGGEFQDWEVLHSSDAAPLAIKSESLMGSSDNFEEIGGDSDSEGIIRSNYFSLDNQGRYVKTGGEFDVSEVGSVESDNPSWIDPGSENQYGLKNSGELWSDSSSDRTEELKVMDVDAKTGFGETIEEGENVYKLDSLEGKFSDFVPKDELDFSEIAKSHSEELAGIQNRDKDFGKFWSDSCGNELVSLKFDDLRKEPEMPLDDIKVDSEQSEQGNEHSTEKGNVQSEELAKADGKPVGEEEKKKKEKIVWWKVPFEVLKYCVFRASPVWSFSVAAAVMGFVILGRRLYKLKRKSQSLKLNVTVDDKKLSQFMTRAARLNEAFSVVRRVPMVRPSLPAAAAGAGAGINPWPVMSMR